MKQTFKDSLTRTKPPFASLMQQLGKKNPKNKILKPQSHSSNLLLKIERATITKTTTEKTIFYLLQNGKTCDYGKKKVHVDII